MCTNEHKNCLKLIKVRFLPICSLKPTAFSFKPSSKDYTDIIASKVAILRARAEQNNMMTDSDLGANGAFAIRKEDLVRHYVA